MAAEHDEQDPEPTPVAPPPIDEGGEAPSVTGVVADDEAAEAEDSSDQPPTSGSR